MRKVLNLWIQLHEPVFDEDGVLYSDDENIPGLSDGIFAKDLLAYDRWDREAEREKQEAIKAAMEEDEILNQQQEQDQQEGMEQSVTPENQNILFSPS